MIQFFTRYRTGAYGSNLKLNYFKLCIPENFMTYLSKLLQQQYILFISTKRASYLQSNHFKVYALFSYY